MKETMSNAINDWVTQFHHDMAVDLGQQFQCALWEIMRHSSYPESPSSNESSSAEQDLEHLPNECETKHDQSSRNAKDPYVWRRLFIHRLEDWFKRHPSQYVLVAETLNEERSIKDQVKQLPRKTSQTSHENETTNSRAIGQIQVSISLRQILGRQKQEKSLLNEWMGR
jgi:hypothetical protein